MVSVLSKSERYPPIYKILLLSSNSYLLVSPSDVIQVTICILGVEAFKVFFGVLRTPFWQAEKIQSNKISNGLNLFTNNISAFELFPKYCFSIYYC